MRKILQKFKDLDKKSKIIVVMIVLSVVMLVVYVMLGSGGEDSAGLGILQNNKSNSEGVIFPELKPEDLSANVNSWKQYKDESGYSVKLPETESTVIKNTAGTMSYYTAGSNQTDRSSFDDGVYLDFEMVNSDQNDLLKYVNSKVSEIESFEGFSVTSRPQFREVNSYKAYEFSALRYGEQRYIIAEGAPGKYLVIVDSTRDSGNKGYETVVDLILKSVVIE